jgi:hypothetical protein
LNNSKLSEDLIFAGNENITRWVRIPKNSTVLESNISLAGIMKPLFSSTGLQIYSLAVGNVILNNDYDEIAVGTSGPAYVKLLSSNGSEIWSYQASNDVYGVSIGNLSSYEGNEVAAGTSDGNVSLLNSSGSLVWSLNIGNAIYDLEAGNVILNNDYDEIAIASGDNRVYLLNSSGFKLWNFTGSSSFKGVGIGNLSSDYGNEVAAGSGDGSLYILNSSGNLKQNTSIGTGINDVAVGNVILSNNYDEIAVAGNNGTIFLLDSNLNILWSFSAQASIDTVLIADITSEYSGSEIIAGSYDDRVYILNSSGSLISSYLTQNDVRGVGVGNLTSDPGNEVVAGTNIPATYTLYILNFEYYPTNVSLDIGNDGNFEWFYSGKFRTQASISNNSAFNNYLTNCEPDSQGNCDIPLTFHSDFAGDLNITSIYLKFEYNLSGIISYSLVDAWSRIYNIRANESIGNKTINISYSRNPALDVKINYIRVNDSATKCDFNDVPLEVVTIDGKKYCNISSLNYTIPSSGSLPSGKLWDDTLTSDIPIIMNESEGKIVENFWRKNITIWNTTPQIFYNITANTTIDELVVISQPKLKFWNGSNWVDLTPSSSSNNCNSSNPTFTKISVQGTGDFYVCKQDTNSNGIEDLFVWKQPHSSLFLYEASGSANHPPILSDIKVTPSQDIWGKDFNISLNVSDLENDNVTVKLWINITSLNVLELIGSKNFTGNQTITFNFSTNKTWVGINSFMFEYADFNSSSGLQYHDWINSSIYLGPNVTKRNASVIYVEGNDTQVNRTETVLLSVRIEDNFENNFVPNASCNFWVMLNETHNSSYSTLSDENGFCNYSFSPNSSYKPGQRDWKAGVYLDPYYETNISAFTLKIYGKLNINLIQKNFTRGNSLIEAFLTDEFNQLAKEAGYNCSFYINDTFRNESYTDSSGYCSYLWKTNCSDPLGYYSINISFSGNANEFYYLNRTSQTITSALKDNLNLTIILPLPNSIYHFRELIQLNSTANDSCGLANYSYQVNWNANSITDQGWPNCSMSAEGENTSLSLPSSCAPGILVIKAKGLGELYNPDEKNVSVWIYGWSEVNFTYPSKNQRINKAETEILNLVCYVKDSNLSVGLEIYPVYFWYLNGSEENLLAQVKTNSSGYATYSWNISSLADYAEVKCNISDTNVSFYRYYNASIKESSTTITIIENDTVPPTIKSLKAEGAVSGQDVKIEANVSDKYGVDKVWVNVSFPNSSSSIFYLQNKTPQITDTTWELTISGLNFIGDYDFVLYANDTSNNSANTTSWFEVYETIQMYLNASFPVDFTFFRPGKEDIIHNFSGNPGNYNFTLHKRTYDWLIKLGENSIKIFNFNTTKTSEIQFGSPTNLTNPINLSQISVSIIDLPKPEKYKISAFSIKTNSSYSNLKITFNYSKDLNDGKIWYEQGIKIFKCSDWVYPSCNSGWVEVNSSLDLTNHLISTTQTSASAYIAAEMEVCGNGKCGYGESCVNCPEDCGQCPSAPGGGGGAGGGVPSAPSLLAPTPTPEEEIKFSIRTNLTQAQIDLNETKNFALWILNEMSSRANFSVSISGSIADLVRLERDWVTVSPKTEGMIVINAYAPPRTELGTYTGTIYVTAGGKTQNVPVTLTVSIKGLAELDIMVEALNKQINPDRVARFRIILYNLGIKKNFDANFTFLIQDPETRKIVFSRSEIKSLQSSYESFIEEIQIPSNISLGQYLFVTEVEYDGRKKSSSDLFEVVQPFWTAERIQLASILLIALFSVFSFFYGRSYYKKWKAKKARYIAPVKIGKLPKGELWLGKVAETRAKATFAMDDLTTHVLVAGATGSGKSVTASLFVEELLEKKIPVVVFDPTAQWTGFVRPCKDPKVLKYYRAFGLLPEDAKPFKGLIFEVTSPNVEIDFKKLMNPGEITIFTLDKLKPGQYDEAVSNIIDTIFSQGWEESTSLKLVIVFDEVHRLLEKYGGKGGYVALERACREFRKWGIGLIMVSQVLSDFKEAIKGNVLTEIQMHTKSLGDLARIEKKYGLEYAKRVARLEVGVGLIQNPKYNDGIPWFISFRPPLHMPHKIPEKEMKMYKEFSKAIEEIERELEIIEKAGMDIFEFKTELKLAKDKLKQGSFRMAEIYITSLKKKLVDFWVGKYGEGKYRRK